MGSVTIPRPVVYAAVAVAIGAVLIKLWPQSRPSYRGY